MIEIDNRSKWKNFSIMLRCKENLDSFSYILDNGEFIIDFDSNLDNIRRGFYLTLVELLDGTICIKFDDKRRLKCTDEIVDNIYYHRNKRYAHKDNDYDAKSHILWEYGDLKSELDGLKIYLMHVKELLIDYLPSNATLDFVSYDRSLFGMVNNLNLKDLNVIKNDKYMYYKNIENLKTGVQKKIMNMDVVEFSCEDGLVDFERLQNRQRFCVSINVELGCDIWCRFNEKIQDDIEFLRSLGSLDEFNRSVDFNNLKISLLTENFSNYNLKRLFETDVISYDFYREIKAYRRECFNSKKIKKKQKKKKK